MDTPNLAKLILLLLAITLLGATFNSCGEKNDSDHMNNVSWSLLSYNNPLKDDKYILLRTTHYLYETRTPL